MNDSPFDPLPPDLADFEAELSALRPSSPEVGFADRVVVESVLRSVTPVAPSAGFADRVVDASLRPERSNVLRFVRLAVPFAAAAALAVWLLPVMSLSPAGGVERVAVVESSPRDYDAMAPESVAGDFADEVVNLPVINLPDGRAYRPVLRSGRGAPSDFRAMPGGAVMPVSFAQDDGVEYHRVDFE